MPVKKGDTIYRITDGKPIRVARTRTLREGLVRLYLTDSRTTDLHHGELGRYAGYSLTQTPELAQRWADTLQALADEQAKWERERAEAKRTRAQYRDILNAPPTVDGPHSAIGEEPDHWGAVKVPMAYGYYVVDDEGEPVERIVRADVSIYASSERQVGEDGEWVRVRVPQVNWSALGSVHPTVARAYANAILIAADAAEQMVITPTEEPTHA